jgi:hypothetical protein
MGETDGGEMRSSRGNEGELGHISSVVRFKVFEISLGKALI